MKKLLAVILLCAIVLNSVCVFSSAEENVETEVLSLNEGFETNSAKNESLGFLSSICAAEGAENLYTVQTSDYRKHSGSKALMFELFAAETVELSGVFSFLESMNDIKNIEVSFWVCAEKMKSEKTQTNVPINVSITDASGNILKGTETSITSDKDFNSENKGFSNITVSADANEITANSKLKLQLGGEDDYPTIVYIDDLEIKGKTSSEAELNKNNAEPHSIRLMRAIGLSNVLTNSYNPEKTLTRADFADVVAGFLNTELVSSEPIKFDDVYEAHYAYNSMKIVSEYGIMSGTDTNKFEPEKEITYMEAVAALVKFLGYERIANENGGYPIGYYSVGVQKGLLSGTNSIKEILTMKQLAEILSDFVDTEILLTETVYELGNNYHITYKTNENATVLEQFFGIRHKSGVVTANDVSGFNGGKTRKGNIEINGVEHVYKGSENIYRLLGCDVEYYCKEPKDETPQVIFVEKSENNQITTVTAKNFEGISGTQLSYMVGNSKKTASVFDCAVIYNGIVKSFSNTMLSETSFVEGEITLIDNDANGRYDVMCIDSFEYYVAEGIDAANEVINDYYSKPSIKLKNYEKCVVLNEEGKTIELSEIKDGNALKIRRSGGTDLEFIEITVCQSQAEGIVSQVKRSGKADMVKVNGRRYEISRFAEKMVSQGTLPEIKVNSSVKLVLANGEIIAWTFGESDALAAYIIRYNKEDKLSYTIQFKVLTEYGALEIYECNSKVMVDGTSRNIKSAEFENTFFPGGQISPQLVKLRLNSLGKIVEIETAADYETGGAAVLEKGKIVKIKSSIPGLFVRRQSGMSYIRSGVSGGGGTNNYATNKQFNISETAKVFVLPEEGGRNENNDKFYTVTTVSEMDHYSTGYKPDGYTASGSYNNLDYLVVKKDNIGGKVNSFKANVSIIKSVENAITEDGEHVLNITCIGKNAETTFTADYSNSPGASSPRYFDYTRLSQGDVIIYNASSKTSVDLYNSEADFFYLLDYDANTKTLTPVYGDLTATSPGYGGKIVGEYGFYFNSPMSVHNIKDGYVYLNDLENIGSDETTAAYNYSLFKTYVINSERETIESGSITEATTYKSNSANASVAYVIVAEGKPVSIFLYK